MSIGQTRGIKAALYVAVPGYIPDPLELIAPMREEYDLPQEFWTSLADHMRLKLIQNLSERIDGEFEKDLAAMEAAATEFMKCLRKLQKTKPGNFIANMAGKETIKDSNFYSAMKKFQNLIEPQTFEGYPAGFYRGTVTLVHQLKPEWGPTELTAFLERLEACFSGLVFPPVTVQHARRDFVRNSMKSAG